MQNRLDRAKAYGYQFFGKDDYYIKKKYRNALEEDGTYYIKNTEVPLSCRPKIGSHDSGPYTGFFSGGFGTASFSRNALGFFDRWQLQPGVLTECVLEHAYFAVWWKIGDEVCHRKLRVSEDGFRAAEVKTYGLFPVVYECYRAQDMPFEIVMERYSPVIPHNLQDSTLPVTLFDIHVRPLQKEQKIEVAICLCWPNLLGWKQPYRTSEQPKGQLWPSLQNAGNYALLEHQDEETIHILQSRETIGQPDDLCGNVMLSMECPGWSPSYDVMFKETLATTGYEQKNQIHTIGKMEYDFRTNGQLSDYEESWQAHWHEATASALAAKTVLGAEEKMLTFVITMDLPITQFGMGRQWYKYYVENLLSRNTRKMAEYALRKRETWLKEISHFHEKELQTNGTSGGCRINELYYLVSGGAVCISRPVEGWTKDNSVLGQHPHFGLLEGFDTGYYYYNTLDLWVYGFTAISLHWPELAEWGFQDYLASARLTETRQNMIYRDKKKMDNLVYGKLPHDLGGCAEDLFVRLNGYNFRDTPNMWKDHNPSFVLAFYLHRMISGQRISKDEFEELKVIMEFTEKQDTLGQGIPSHDEFGDSTWDNLHMKGLSAYCSSLCIGAWAVMKELASQYQDAKADFYDEQLKKAQKTIQKLWNGRYFTTDECGKYRNATMSDAMFGILLAAKAGLKDLLPAEQIRSHLLAAFENNFEAFAGGRYGALLVAEPSVQKYEKDGGDEMQVNEVLVGSSWVLAACLREFGLEKEADRLAEAMRTTMKTYALYYRTPAAWSGDGLFRAPMNMRPLAVWLDSIMNH